MHLLPQHQQLCLILAVALLLCATASCDFIDQAGESKPLGPLSFSAEAWITDQIPRNIEVNAFRRNLHSTRDYTAEFGACALQFRLESIEGSQILATASTSR